MGAQARTDQDVAASNGQLKVALEIRECIALIALFVKEPTEATLRSALEAKRRLDELLPRFEKLSRTQLDKAHTSASQHAK